ncbi:MAG: hypothetical protein LBD94_00175 [Rickettsiales bacterium]|jgi:hypothetical protein|nr:hypothetical protein [Rickettsiales bacterium]
MKQKILFIPMAFVTVGAFAACPTGYVESEQYAFYVQDTDSCPNGYVETNEIKMVDNSVSCPTGWDEAPEIKEVACDSSKGVCASGFTCIIP